MANERIPIVDDQPTVAQTCAAILLEDEKGNITGTQDTAHEIGERRGVEERLRQSEEDYRQLFESASDAILLINNETGQILQANNAACTLYGYNCEEMLANKNTDLSAEPEQTRRLTSGTRVAADQVVTVPLRYHRKKDGTVFPVEITGRFFLHRGRPVHIAVIRDITARKQAEDDLHNALAELTAIDQNAPIGMLLVDRELRLHKVNGFTARFAGRPAVEMTGLRADEALRCVHNLDDPRGCGSGPACAACLGRQAVLDTFETRTSQQDVEAWLSFLRGGSCVECCLLISTAYLEIDATERVLVCAQDITKQKRAEEQLEAEKEWSEAIVSAAPNMVVGLGERSTILIFNEAAETSTGYAASEVMGKEWIDLFIPREMQEELHGVWDEIVANGLIEHHYENLISTKTGEQRLISWHNTVLTEDGKFKLVLSIGEDVTERNQAEAVLHASEERYRSLVENAPDAIYVHFDDRVVLVNRACLQLFGAHSEVELLDKSIYDLFHPDFHPVVRERVHLVRNLGEPVPLLEEKILRLDGGVVDVEVTATPFPFGGGNAVHVIMRDITERKRDEEALQQRAWQLALLNEIGSKVAALLNLDQLLDRAAHLVQERFGFHYVALFTRAAGGDRLVARAAAGECAGLFGGRQSVALGQGMIGWVGLHGTTLLANDVDLEPRYFNPYPDHLPTRSELSVPICIGNEILGVLDMQSPQLNAFDASDVTTWETLAAQVATAINNARLYSQAAQRNRELALLNRVIAACAAGQAIEPILETVCRELACYFDVPQAAAALFDEARTRAVVVAEYCAEGRPSGLGEVIPVAGNPSIQYLLDHKAPLAVDEAQSDPRLASVHNLMRRRGTFSLLLAPLLVKGEVVGSLGLDAAEFRHFGTEEINLVRRVIEQAGGALARTRLEETRQRLSTAVEQSSDSVFITDTQGVILYVNPSFESATGYRSEEVVGRNPRLLRSGKHDETFYRNLWQTIGTGQVWRGRLVNRTRDGSLYTTDTTITPVHKPDGTIVNYVATERDVTRELELEEQFHQAQKMEALGRLAGGVAHDFGNVLTVINISARLMEKQLRPEDPLLKHLERIQDAGQRAASLSRQLLSFSRKEITRPQILDLTEVLGAMLKMLQRILGDDVELTTVLPEDLWPVEMDPGQVDQILVNLAVNAQDAMPQGGRLTIETANAVLDEGYAANRLDVQPGEYVVLSVSDTGVGMDDEVKAHLFEPFFTTKERGKGTGLGLATVFGIVKQHGGHIWVYSELGLGTVFKIYLPRAGAEAADVPWRKEPDRTVGGAETLLVVEDEPDLRVLVKNILTAHGYRVLAAADGVEALAISEQYDGPIHLLLTDMVMPRLSGIELTQQVRQQRPEIKVLYISGYADRLSVQQLMADPGIKVLSKPFTLEALTGEVRAMLESKSPAAKQALEPATRITTAKENGR